MASPPLHPGLPLHLAAGQRLEPEAVVTLRPKHGMKMTLHRPSNDASERGRRDHQAEHSRISTP